MNYSAITPYIKELAALSDTSNHIVPDMYTQYDVKRGLRDINGNGVVAGLTEVSHIKAKTKDAHFWILKINRRHKYVIQADK